jgi:tetratricopeptide (TPR) repeat protein
MSEDQHEATSPISAARALFKAGYIESAEAAAAEIIAKRPTPGAAMLYARCAVARGDWGAALQRWQYCRTEFPDRRADAEAGRGHALMHLGQLDEARMAFEAARALEPDDLSYVVGLARVAGRRRRFDEAIGLWREAITGATPPVLPAWHMGLAYAQMEGGDATAALETVRSLEREQPNFRGTFGLHARLLVELGLREEAAAELAHGRYNPGSGQWAERLRLQIFLGDMPAARAEFAVWLGQAESALGHERLFLNIPILFAPKEQRRLWSDLRHRLTPMASGGDAEAAALLLRLAVAETNIGEDKPLLLAELEAAPSVPAPWDGHFQRLVHILRGARGTEWDPRAKVFGIGLSRTGTTSLSRSLEHLGLLTGHFRNPFSGVMLSPDDAELLDAMTDTPVCGMFEALYERYPEARFILTERSLPDWEASLSGLFERTFGTADFGALRAQCSAGGELRYGPPWAKLHMDLLFQYADAAAAWRAYHERVDAFFADKPAEKLLRIDLTAGAGWDELCGFLGVEAPVGAFPWENRSKK